MQLKYILAAGMISLAATAQAQEWITDTADMSAAYANNVYYSLETGTVKSEAANNWDIAIKTGSYTAGVFANHAGTATKVYALTGVSASEKFGTDLSADTVGVASEANALYNSIENWENGAFNADGGSTMIDYGWGEYDMSSHWVTGDKIYLVITSGGAYQAWIEEVATFNSESFPVENPPLWKFHIANIDGSNVKDKEININPTYTNSLFAYYSIAEDEFLNRDPENNAWDILFTQYFDEVAPGMMYKVTGVLQNDNRPVVNITGEGASETEWTSSLAEGFDTNINAIGRGWKGSLASFTDPVYPMTADLTFFIKVANGDIWQLEFTYASVGSTSSSSDPTVLPGRVGLRKRKVFSAPTEIKQVNSFVNNIILAPNPSSNGFTNLLVDAKQQIKDAQIAITDLSGRVVMKTTQSINPGFQQLSLNVSNYVPGLYFVNISAQGWSNTQKLIIK